MPRKLLKKSKRKTVFVTVEVDLEGIVVVGGRYYLGTANMESDIKEIEPGGLYKLGWAIQDLVDKVK